MILKSAFHIIGLVTLAIVIHDNQVHAASNAFKPDYHGDLPPPGTRSLFDHWIDAEGGVPYPYSKLLKRLEIYSNSESAVINVLIPDGRSLVKSKGSFKHPRILTTVSEHPAESSDRPTMRNRLFIGFVEEAAQLEVISYNEDIGRFEFQLVEEYRKGATPEVFYAKRGLCMACHQDGSTLFSVRPWSETNSNPEIAQTMASAMNTGLESRYHSVLLRQPLKQAETFDRLTDNASNLLTSQKVWLEGCGLGQAAIECRRLTLQLLLRLLWSPLEFNRDVLKKQELIALQKKHWPQRGIALGNPNLANRNPMIEPDWSIEQWVDHIFSNEDAISQSVDAIRNLPELQNPLAMRTPEKVLSPTSLDAVFGLSQLFVSSDIEKLRAAADGNFDRVAQVINSLDQESSILAWPLQRHSAMNTLLVGLDAPPLKSLGEFYTESSSLGPAKTQGGDLQLLDDSPLTGFSRYCFDCHRDNPVAELNLMSGSTEAKVWGQMRKTATAIESSLNWEDSSVPIMPPEGSQQWMRMMEDEKQGKRPIQKLVSALDNNLSGTPASVNWLLVVPGFIIISGVLFWLFKELRFQRKRQIWLDQQLQQNQPVISSEGEMKGSTNDLKNKAQLDDFLPFHIVEKTLESKQAVTLKLSPDADMELAAFKAGQYITVKLPVSTEKNELIRCYSLSGRSNIDNYLITVKQEQPAPESVDQVSGRASSWLVNVAVPGDSLQVKKPTGHFCLPLGEVDDYVFIAGGIGITPIACMLDELAAKSRHARAFLFYGVRNGEHHTFRARLEALKKRLPDLFIQTFYSQPEDQDQLGVDYDVAGRMTLENIRQTLDNKQAHYFVCGPESMIYQMVNGLKNWGADPQKISFEAFQAIENNALSTDSIAKSSEAYTVSFTRSGKKVSWTAESGTILKLAQSQNVVLPCGCSSGNCGTCQVKIKSGSVHYSCQHDFEPEVGYCLACVSQPSSNLVLDA